MSKTAHRIYIWIFIVIVGFAFFTLVINGTSYYSTSIEERFYHPDHAALKPSGVIGHGLGIVGTFCMIIGVGMYMVRKRVRRFRQVGILKYWLEFHIFLCTLGPVLVLFHTAFKFGGIVSVSFWSMVGVVASGVVGRFIYVRIPRTIEGRELTLNEVREMRENISHVLKEEFRLTETGHQAILAATVPTGAVQASGPLRLMSRTLHEMRTMRQLRAVVKTQGLSRSQGKHVLALARDEIRLNGRIERLQMMQKLFRYWHVAHLPFAIIMMIIMLVHVGVTLAFGYKWIF